ncbi:MAG TPA: winged helix-turn-helix domain-containing protein [Nitrospirota bacterium]|nr:winged helix-turn-helix domain-containing protein [Nitrospirota bacterium]
MRKSHNEMEVRSKVWVEMDGEPVFGRGRRFLLEAIDTHGSINQAAREVDMSYRKAWGHIKAMEARLGVRLIERQTGGKNGGGARLTAAARMILSKFELLEVDIRAFADEKFRTLFTGGSHV